MGSPRYRSHHLFRFASGLLSIFLVGLLPQGIFAQTTFTVTSTDDVDDGTCDAAHCSLREALTAANSAEGGAIIAFNIPGPGPHTIQPMFGLPNIEENTTLDGTTEPDFAGVPVIELDGSAAGAANGLNVVLSNNTIRGLVINRFQESGIHIHADAANNTIEGCYVGTDVTGTVGQGNGNAGVMIGQAPNNTVGGVSAAARNVISGNIEGITVVDASATGNVILGNFIGTNATGDAAIPNQVGVSLLAPDNTVGGTEPGAGNLISGNSAHGVNLGPPNSTGNLIVGNYIGVDAAGTTALGNDIGVWVDNVPGNTIGGLTAGARNVISGNREGVTLWDAGATGNLIQGNYIGTTAAGDAAIPNEMGVPVYGPGNTIGGTESGAGNLISGNQTNGVNFYGENAVGNIVQGNLIGTDATGTMAVGNADAGVALHNLASQNTIGGTEAGARNILSGNTFGILIGDLSISETRIQGNYVGTSLDGISAIPNTQSGILLWGENTLIGGPEAGAGNVISGNLFAGIDMGGGSNSTTIQGNYIGTDGMGATVLGNDVGIFVNHSFQNVIGGTSSGAGNVISGNVSQNITINGPDASGNTLQGNFIGTDATGTVALESGRAILVLDAPDNIIGGIVSGAGNVISGNRPGVSFEGPGATGNLLQGNLLGTDITGSVPLGNRGATVRFTNGASNNTVGGLEPGAGNVIANSTWVGIGLFPDAGTGNRILSNAIFGNSGLGIELNRDGVTPNDEGDSDTGPNDLQNYPEIQNAVSYAGGAIEATLNSTPSSTFTVDFFSGTECHETGFGEGRNPLGNASLTTDASGFGTLTRGFSDIPGTLVTATATDSDGNTSEFSQCAPVSTLALSPSPTTRTVTQGQSALYTLLVTAEGGSFEETFTLSCSGNPAGTTCTFDQDQVTLAAGQASASMTVTTVAPAGLAPMLPQRPLVGPTSFGLLALLGLASLLGLAALLTFSASDTTPWGRFTSSKGGVGKMAARGLLAAALLLVPVACGDDGANPPTGGTPPGSYDLTVTAAWETVQLTTTATMVVQ